MTKKDFKLIAAALSRLSDSPTRKEVVEVLADALEETNIRLDRAKFVAAVLK